MNVADKEIVIKIKDLNKICSNIADVKTEITTLMSELWKKHRTDPSLLKQYDKIGYAIQQLEQTIDSLNGTFKEEEL